jgi:hypothetical protein
MSGKRTHLDLSTDFLKNAENVVAEISINKTAKERLERAACHCFYYSIYHQYIHRDPTITDKTRKIRHKEVCDLLTAKDSVGGGLYIMLLNARVWADYMPATKSSSPTPFKLSKIIVARQTLSQIIDNIK